MPPERPPERRWFSWHRLTKLLVVLFAALVLLALLFPARPVSENAGKRLNAQNDVNGLVAALKFYHTEYGVFPPLGTSHIEDESTQTRLLQILRAEDPNHALNPRRVVFFDARTARKRGWWGQRKYVSGIHPETGALIDPWGKPYRIRLDTAYTRKTESPYNGSKEISAPVLVWSLGKDGIQGSPGKENILEGSDDIVSWQ